MRWGRWGRGDSKCGTNRAAKACPDDVIEAIKAVIDFIGDDELLHREDHRRMCHVFESITRIEKWLVDPEWLTPIRGRI